MKPNQTKKSGYALVTVMGIMAVLAMAFSMLMTSGGQNSFTSKRLKNKAKATSYAEAGIEFAYSILRDDYNKRLTPSVFLDGSNQDTTGNTLTSAFGDGSFTLTIQTNSTAQFTVINSVGKCGEYEKEVEVLIEDLAFNSNGTPDPIPNYENYTVFNKAMATASSASFAGGGSIHATAELVMHSNLKFTITGGIDVPCSVSSSVEVDTGNKNNAITGSVTAPSITGTGPSGATEAKISGAYKNNTTVDTVTIPEIKMNPYRLHAIANGAFIDTGNNSTVYTISSNPPGGGVWYIRGSVSIPPGASITATIIATGNIDNKGDVIQTHGIALGTLNGNISYASQATSEGMVYTQTGTFTQVGGGGSGVITGQIITGSDISKGGGGDLIFGKYLPLPPKDGVETPNTNTAEPVIAAWQK